MKRNLYLVAAGLILSSCTEPGDVVTGYARIVMKNQPAPVAVAPVVAPAPAPEPIVEAPAPAPEPQPIYTPEPVVAQNQPVTTEPEPVIINEPVVAEPAVQTEPTPAAVVEAEEKKPQVEEKPAAVVAPVTAAAATPAVAAQQQPVTTTPPAARATVVTRPAPAPAPVAAPVVAPKPQAPRVTPTQQAAAPRVQYNAVTQNQPVTTIPQQVNWRTPQKALPKKDYPTMPGQNRGLRNRKPKNNRNYYY